MRFGDKTNKSVLSDADIFPLSSGSGDYNITWGQITALIRDGLIPQFITFLGNGISSISAGSNADVASIELYNTIANNAFEFDLCLNFDVTLASGSSNARVTVSLVTVGGNLVRVSQDYFADGRYLLNLHKHIVLASVGNYLLAVNVAVTGGSLG